MSIVHKIVCTNKIDFSKFLDFIAKNEFIQLEFQGKETLFFWWNKESTRGFDVSFIEDYIEIRNTILSNEFDFELTNLIVAKLSELSNGNVLNEKKKPVSLPLFNQQKIKKIERNDAKTILLFSKKQTFTIYGPIRKIHFGKRMYLKYKNLNSKELKNNYHQLIKTINFDYSNFEYENVLSCDNGIKTLKLLTNQTNILIDHYDFIGFQMKNKEQIVITNDRLISILPDSWKLLDEYTIAAPMLSDNEWNKLLGNAIQFNISNTFMDL